MAVSRYIEYRPPYVRGALTILRLIYLRNLSQNFIQSAIDFDFHSHLIYIMFCRLNQMELGLHRLICFLLNLSNYFVKFILNKKFPIFVYYMVKTHIINTKWSMHRSRHRVVYTNTDLNSGFGFGFLGGWSGCNRMHI